MSLLLVLDRFFALQQDRSRAYSEFQQALAELVEDKDVPKYTERAEEVTNTFQRIAKEVREIEAELRKTSQAQVAETIAALRTLEQAKLQETVRGHALNIKYRLEADEQYSTEFTAQDRWLRTELARIVGDINAHLEELTMLRLEAREAAVEEDNQADDDDDDVDDDCDT